MHRYGNGSDWHALQVALITSSILIWLPYSIAAIYTAYCNSFPVETKNFNPLHVSKQGMNSSTPAPGYIFGTPHHNSLALFFGGFRLSSIYDLFNYYVFPSAFDLALFLPVALQVLAFSLIAIIGTWVLAVRVENGSEFLFILSWVLGIFSEFFWLTSNVSRISPSRTSQTLSFIPIPASSSPVTVAVDRKPIVYNYHYPTIPSWMWLAVSIATGLFSGILCKVKDVLDAKVVRGDHIHRIFEYPAHETRQCEHSNHTGTDPSQMKFQTRKKHVIGLGERLYILLPFFTGQWFSFLLKNGWRGFVVQTGITVLTLGMVGYCMVSFKLLKQQLLSRGIIERRRRTRKMVKRSLEQINISEKEPLDHDLPAEPTKVSLVVTEEEYFDVSLDIVELISRLFTSSFGVVILVVVVMDVFVTSLAIPFLKALSSLNALVNGVGIVIELIIYEIV